MSTSTVPLGNPAGFNQANPALANKPAPILTPVAGGSTPSSTNPYMFGVGTGGTPSGTVPSASPSTPTGVPIGVNPIGTAAAPTGTAPGAATTDPLQKQMTDILGKGVGGAETQMIEGMSGEQSAAYQQLVASLAPTFQQQQNTLTQALGAAGVSPNSTVEATGLADLMTQQGATLAGQDASMIMQNEQLKANMLQNMNQLASQEVSQSGWDVFGQIAQSVGALAAPFTGGISSAIGNLFSKPQNAYLSTPSVGWGGGSDVSAISAGAPTSIPYEEMETLPIR